MKTDEKSMQGLMQGNNLSDTHAKADSYQRADG